MNISLHYEMRFVKYGENMLYENVDSCIADEDVKDIFIDLDDYFGDCFDPMITGIGDMQIVNLSDFLEE